jgi:hypothetical protein
MIDEFVEFLLQPKFHGFICYAHNFSKFDGPIILGHLSANKNITLKTTYSGNKLYELVIRKKSVRVSLRDSLNLAAGSLASLAKSFNVSTKKGFFPHEFSSPETLNYQGVSPCGSIESWCFKTELLSYLRADVDALYEVMIELIQKLGAELDHDITRHLTASSVALGVFRSQFMDCKKIPLIKGNCARAVRKAYRGGVVEVYKPRIERGYYYDINSLYPSAMLSDMPVGVPRYVINPQLGNFFGFVEARITCPDMLVPFLPTTVDGVMICGTGS